MAVERAYLGLDLGSSNEPKGKGSVGITIPTNYAYGFATPATYPNNLLPTPRLIVWGVSGDPGTFGYPLSG